MKVYGYKTNGNFLASHTFIPSDASDYQVIGEGSKGSQTGLISGISPSGLGAAHPFEIRSEALSPHNRWRHLNLGIRPPYLSLGPHKQKF